MCTVPLMNSRLCRRGAFTLIELLVVIVIIAILASLILIGLATARRKSQWSQCSSNLHEFGIAFTDYLGQNSERTPPWLSSLYSDGSHGEAYTSAREIFICPGDAKRGKIDGSKPQDLIDDYKKRYTADKDPDPAGAALRDAFNETDDNWGNHGIDACSYFYEMCDTKCTLSDAGPGRTPPGPPNETWAAYKRWEMQTIADKSKFPVIRCYHHWKDRRYLVTPPPPKVGDEMDGMTINVSIQGNVFFAPENWKATIKKVYE